MRAGKKTKCSLRREDGVAVVLVTLLAFAFVALTALAVDIGHLYVVRNELHNAADAGALAGARQLLNPDGTTINGGANQLAFDAARDNNSERLVVEVNSPLTNLGDVQRGHWSFTTHTFTANANLTQKIGWRSIPTATLDTDPDFINAVRVATRRQGTQAKSFFAGVLGYFGFNVAAEAVAYIGFAGELLPLEVDQPIAICKQSLTLGCATGRMMIDNLDSAAWTNFDQPSGCSTAAADAKSVNVYVKPCPSQGVNQIALELGGNLGITNGNQGLNFNDLQPCWLPPTLRLDTNSDGTPDQSLDTDGDGLPDQPWRMTLPVINCCPDDNPYCTEPKVGNCRKIVGAVVVDVLWINRTGEGNILWPHKMAGWTCSKAGDEECWDEFVETFSLVNYDGSKVENKQDAIYFKQDCTPNLPTGVTGGENFGILAKIPVLVR